MQVLAPVLKKVSPPPIDNWRPWKSNFRPKLVVAISPSVKT